MTIAYEEKEKTKERIKDLLKNPAVRKDANTFASAFEPIFCNALVKGNTEQVKEHLKKMSSIKAKKLSSAVSDNSKLSGYTWTNRLLIAYQQPDATWIAGIKSWEKAGYKVKKDESAIYILTFAKLLHKKNIDGVTVPSLFPGLTEEREKRGLNENGMAKLLGIPVSQYRLYENGMRMIAKEEFDIISNTLGIDCEKFKSSYSKWTNMFFPTFTPKCQPVFDFSQVEAIDPLKAVPLNSIVSKEKDIQTLNEHITEDWLEKSITSNMNVCINYCDNMPNPYSVSFNNKSKETKININKELGSEGRVFSLLSACAEKLFIDEFEGHIKPSEYGDTLKAVSEMSAFAAMSSYGLECEWIGESLKTLNLEEKDVRKCMDKVFRMSDVLGDFINNSITLMLRKDFVESVKALSSDTVPETSESSFNMSELIEW